MTGRLPPTRERCFFAHLDLEPLHAFLRRTCAQIPMTILPVMVRAEAIAKEVEALVPGIPDYGLRLVEGKPELGHYQPRPRQCLIRKSAAEDDEVVGIGDDMSSVGFTSSSAPPVLEEAVHVDVGEQRADHPAVRSAIPDSLSTCHAQFPVGISLLDRRSESQLDQPEHVPVDDALRHRPHQI
jgi:hypothetical protein